MFPFFEIEYTNAKGKTAWRKVIPSDKGIYYGSHPLFYPTPRWLIEVWDQEKNAKRTLELSKVSGWRFPAPDESVPVEPDPMGEGEPLPPW